MISKDLAMEAMLGSTPRDMYYRVKDLDEVKELAKDTEQLLHEYEEFQNKKEDDVWDAGRLVGYVAALKQNGSPEAQKILSELSKNKDFLNNIGKE